mgnify:FL=1
MTSYAFLLAIAIILLSTKLFGLLSQRVHMPAVVGALVAGILLGPSCFGFIEETDFLLKTSEIGVIFLMFLAGLDTDLDELKKTGFASFIIAVIGVLVPLGGGYLCYHFFYNAPGDPLNMLKALFIGVVLTATSVSITVETLREMGRLRGKVGTAILGAAVIDDILGIIILTVITGFTDPDSRPAEVFIRIALFFVFIALVGFVMYKVFQRMDTVWGNKRRIAIATVSFCFILSYVAEAFFGIADITGAYFAGIILCNIWNLREYLAKKINVVSYMFFSPVFFASIGIKTELSGFTTQLLAFSVVVLIIAVLSKIIGCGIGARICGFNNHDAFIIGLGMVSRGEVALIVAQKGAQAGLIDSALFPPIVLMVIVTTLITPILLKIFMDPGHDDFKSPEIQVPN